MVSDVTTVGELIGLWPSAEVFARDLRLKHTSHGRVMSHRGSINRCWWDDVVLSASRRGIEGVTHALLERIHAGKPARKRLKRRNDLPARLPSVPTPVLAEPARAQG